MPNGVELAQALPVYANVEGTVGSLEHGDCAAALEMAMVATNNNMKPIHVFHRFSFTVMDRGVQFSATTRRTFRSQRSI